MAVSLRSRRRKQHTDRNKRSVIVTRENTIANEDELAVFANEVLNEITKDGLEPTPSKFAIYYEKLLQEKNEKFRIKVIRILKSEEYNNKELVRQQEQNLTDAISLSKKIFSTVLTFQKNLIMINKVLKKRLSESVSIANSLEKDVNKLQMLLASHTKTLKANYSETAINVKCYESSKIMSDKFNVYNKSYLLSQLQREQKSLKEYKYSSSLAIVSISKSLKSTIHSKRTLEIVNRTIVKQLLKTQRKGDIVAYYKNDMFLIMLSHTNLITAEKILQNISTNIFHSNLFLGETEISITISAGVSNISHSLTEEEIIDAAVENRKDI